MSSDNDQIKDNNWLEASKKMSMKSPYKIQDKKAGSCAIVRTLYSVLQINIEEVQTSE
jgi:hypothetical protein